MGKLNRSVSEAKEFIEQNTGKMSNAEMGHFLGGVSAARVSQLRSSKKQDDERKERIADYEDVPQSVSQEAAASTAEA